jgi:hypothetical protein
MTLSNRHHRGEPAAAARQGAPEGANAQCASRQGAPDVLLHVKQNIAGR